MEEKIYPRMLEKKVAAFISIRKREMPSDSFNNFQLVILKNKLQQTTSRVSFNPFPNDKF